MQSGKTRGDVLVTITERLSRQHIMRHVSGRNSQAVTPAIIRFFKGIKMLNQLQLITVESLQNMMK
jgi:IS30 family transposase